MAKPIYVQVLLKVVITLSLVSGLVEGMTWVAHQVRN